MHFQHSEVKRSVWTEHRHHPILAFFVLFQKHIWNQTCLMLLWIYQIPWFSDETGTGLVLIKRVKEELQSTYSKEQSTCNRCLQIWSIWNDLCYHYSSLDGAPYILISGLYNPPKHKYQGCNLMSHLINFLDNTLDKDPNTVFACGGDLNHLDLNGLQSMSSWKALVDLPTRGDVCLDNCLTNRPDIFNKCHSFQLSIKTDHTAVILLAGTKLKPICCKVLIIMGL